MHYETGVGLKPEFIDGARDFIEHTMTLDIFKNNGLPRYFVWIDHEEKDELDGMVYNSMAVDEYNMLAPHGQIRVEHDRVHEMINDAFGVQGSVVQGHNERETGDFYSYYFGDSVSCRINRPNRNDEGDTDILFPLISIYNQNGRRSKKCGKRGFTDM
ncbi:hypothetical protein H5410_016452 [Solanum commersonii]|uniref:Uncharacterized protein n=1 Tax=Solanum commersonii TaxID=4109 RepID=A0A9J5ZXE7_SOLCO|nr:hypothetical protein H5410_016452 [Solanum commersonii]